MRQVTILSYHYVRDLKRTRYPEIKGLDLINFKGQIEYLLKHYQFITMEEFLLALHGNLTLPKNSVMLTFDDGYLDHYESVFPILRQKGIQGSFFIPVAPLLEGTVLDVNKIHFILATALQKTKFKELHSNILSLLDKYRVEFNLNTNEYYLNINFPGNGLDTKEVIFIKRLLQSELPEIVRSKIVNELFLEYVGVSESIFSRELYMSRDQILAMKHDGMYFGSHGYKHYWLNSLDREQQFNDIKKSLDFLIDIGINEKDWTICYPYGAYNAETIEVLKELNCRAAFIDPSVTDITYLDRVSYFEFPRIDTIEFPYSFDQKICKWTEKMIQG
ncbi:MAG: polysaccharide deacetylase family protein [Leptospira sp.]|nr:polysaccharide deacetylase family protein [Leptospira sp.]